MGLGLLNLYVAYVIGVDADDEADDFSPQNSPRLLNVSARRALSVSAQIVGSLLMTGLANVTVAYEDPAGTFIFLMSLYEFYANNNKILVKGFNHQSWCSIPCFNVT